MKLADRITSVLLVILSGFWIYWARQLPFPKFAQISKMGPGDFPTVIAVMLAIFAIWLFIGTFRYPIEEKDSGGDDESEITRNPDAVRDILTGFGLFTVMLFLVPFLGFSLSSALFVFFLSQFDRPVSDMAVTGDCNTHSFRTLAYFCVFTDGSPSKRAMGVLGGYFQQSHDGIRRCAGAVQPDVHRSGSIDRRVDRGVAGH